MRRTCSGGAGRRRARGDARRARPRAAAAAHSGDREGHHLLLLADRARRRAARPARICTSRCRSSARSRRADINGQISHPRERGLREAGRDRDRADAVRGPRPADRRGGEVGEDHRHRQRRRIRRRSPPSSPPTTCRAAASPRTGWRRRSRSRYGKPEGEVALITSLPGVGSLDQRAAGLQGGAGGEISRPQAGRRQGGGRPGDHRAQHHDRPDHRQSRPARGVREQPHHGAGRRRGDRREQGRRTRSS